MDDKNSEPTGPPPVTKASSKGTKINITGADQPAKEKPVPEPDVETPAPESEAPVDEPTPAPVPVTAADKDLQSLDMGDDTPAPPRAKPPKSGGSKKKILVPVIILLIAAAIGAWFLLKKPKSQSPAPAATQPKTTTPAADNSQPTTPTTKTYKNDTIKVELSYPSTWKTTESSNQVVFTSPQVSYTKKDGSSTKGSFRLIVQKGFTQTDSTTINNGVAVKTSETLKYTAPATGQRTESFLSFLGTDKNTFNFILITSGKQYNPGDTVAATLPLTQDSYIVAGGYGKGKGENIDFDAISPTKIDQNSVYTQAVEIIKSLKITG